MSADFHHLPFKHASSSRPFIWMILREAAINLTTYKVNPNHKNTSLMIMILYRESARRLNCSLLIAPNRPDGEPFLWTLIFMAFQRANGAKLNICLKLFPIDKRCQTEQLKTLKLDLETCSSSGAVAIHTIFMTHKQQSEENIVAWMTERIHTKKAGYNKQ